MCRGGQVQDIRTRLHLEPYFRNANGSCDYLQQRLHWVAIEFGSSGRKRNGVARLGILGVRLLGYLYGPVAVHLILGAETGVR